MRQQYPEMKDWGVNLITFTDTFVSPQLRTALLVLLGAVGDLVKMLRMRVEQTAAAAGAPKQSQQHIRQQREEQYGRDERRKLRSPDDVKRRQSRNRTYDQRA